jgi:anti-sigma regulatory factor (Ser/Thr protein kinase)
MRIVAERLTACGFDVRPAEPGGDPGLLAVTNPVTDHHAEILFEDDSPTCWQVWGETAEGADAGTIADHVVRMLAGDTAGDASTGGYQGSSRGTGGHCGQATRHTPPGGAAAAPSPFGIKGSVPHEHVQEVTFSRDPREVAWARRFVRGVLGAHPAAQDAELLASELVTNCVLHASDAARVTVTVAVRGAVVHIAVADDGLAGLPHWRDTGAYDEGGRGFRLVNEIAERWGFFREKAQPRTCSWFEL